MANNTNGFGTSEEATAAKLVDMFRQGILEIDEENNKVATTGWIALKTVDQFQTRFEVPFELYRQCKDKALGSWKERQLKMNQEMEKENKDNPQSPSPAPAFGQTSVSMPQSPYRSTTYQRPQYRQRTQYNNNSNGNGSTYNSRPRQQTGPKKPYMSKDDQIDANLFGPGRTWYHKKPEENNEQLP